jgi:hypothetical protein
MKAFLLATICAAVAFAPIRAADLPTVTIDHLYYLFTRGEIVRRLDAEEMIDYCVALKIGGRAFEDLYAQVFAMKIGIMKLRKLEKVNDNDPRLVALLDSHAEHSKLLEDEAKRVQKGLEREGRVVNDTLVSIAKVQPQQQQ